METVASAVVSHKVNNMVGGIQKELGFDDKKGKKTSEYDKAAMERLERRKKAEREEEKQIIHDKREAQRQRMKNKYSLDVSSDSKSAPKRNSNSSSELKLADNYRSTSQEDTEEDKKCVVS